MVSCFFSWDSGSTFYASGTDEYFNRPSSWSGVILKPWAKKFQEIRTTYFIISCWIKLESDIITISFYFCKFLLFTSKVKCTTTWPSLAIVCVRLKTYRISKSATSNHIRKAWGDSLRIPRHNNTFIIFIFTRIRITYRSKHFITIPAVYLLLMPILKYLPDMNSVWGPGAFFTSHWCSVPIGVSSKARGGCMLLFRLPS